ncbi:MAG: PEP-CTERM sorting domain-containing protein [Kiritimatiellales bacterium]|nr:PEP-CTERM sorting domain-containing protein [Kiritimatiellales bacterium]
MCHESSSARWAKSSGRNGKDWTLDYSEASGAGVLSLTVIPEPAALGMVAVAGIALIGVRRLRLI